MAVRKSERGRKKINILSGHEVINDSGSSKECRLPRPVQHMLLARVAGFSNSRIHDSNVYVYITNITWVMFDHMLFYFCEFWGLLWGIHLSTYTPNICRQEVSTHFCTIHALKHLHLSVLWMRDPFRDYSCWLSQNKAFLYVKLLKEWDKWNSG